ncbi:hypothetical protein BC940DRAFT_288176 [Gongronella butleri]|nr:hypothetical protein BC940DRAFT_288176 [Gongronella butleri]
MDNKKLYVGNFDTSIDEYALLKLFKPFGKIVQFEYMFHLHGPNKGTPRGYCFLEYGENKSSLEAISAMDGKMLRGRKLVVSFANKNPHANNDTPHSSKRPPSLTMRNQRVKQLGSTDAKIMAIEAKLARMQKTISEDTHQASSSSSSPTSSAPASRPSSRPSSTSSSSSSQRFKPY